MQRRVGEVRALLHVPGLHEKVRYTEKQRVGVFMSPVPEIFRRVVGRLEFWLVDAMDGRSDPPEDANR